MTAPTLTKLVEDVTDARLAALRVCRFARVENYDPVRRLVDVKPLVRQAYTNEDAERVSESLDVIPDVPVIFPSCGAFVIEFPIVRGDFVLVVHTDHATGAWLQGDGSETEPEDDATHALKDAVAFAGLFPQQGTRPSAPSNALTLGSADGARIWIRQGQVALGEENPLDAVLRGTTYRNADATFDTSLASASTALGTAATTLSGILVPLAAGPAPANSLNTFVLAVSAFCTALASAANAKEAGSATYLSSVVKVAP